LAEDEEPEFRQDVIAMPSPAMLHQPTRAGLSTVSSFLNAERRSDMALSLAARKS
jgi:hypothetical protein